MVAMWEVMKPWRGGAALWRNLYRRKWGQTGSHNRVWISPEEFMLHPWLDFCMLSLVAWRDKSLLAYLNMVEGPLGQIFTLEKDPCAADCIQAWWNSWELGCNGHCRNGAGLQAYMCPLAPPDRVCDKGLMGGQEYWRFQSQVSWRLLLLPGQKRPGVLENTRHPSCAHPLRMVRMVLPVVLCSLMNTYFHTQWFCFSSRYKAPPLPSRANNVPVPLPRGAWPLTWDKQPCAALWRGVELCHFGAAWMCHAGSSHHTQTHKARLLHVYSMFLFVYSPTDEAGDTTVCVCV
jgi:hypothetical protein